MPMSSGLIMPLQGSGGFFVLTCYLARPLQAETLFNLFWQLQTRFDLSVLWQSPTEMGAPAVIAPLDKSQFAEYYKQCWVNGQQTVQQHPELQLAETITLQFTLPPAQRAIRSPNNRRRRLSFSATAAHYLNGVQSLIFILNFGERQGDNAYLAYRHADRIMALFAKIGRYLVDQLQPDYLWIAEDGIGTWHVQAADIRKHRLQTIYWVNYVDDHYLGARANSLILHAPIGRVSKTAHGIWLQLHPRFENVPEPVVAEIERQAWHHFAPLEIERVQWKFSI